MLLKIWIWKGKLWSENNLCDPDAGAEKFLKAQTTRQKSDEFYRYPSLRESLRKRQQAHTMASLGPIRSKALIYTWQGGTDLKNAVLSHTKFKKEKVNCSTLPLYKLRTQTLKTMLHILEGYISNRTEQLPTATGIGNEKEKNKYGKRRPCSDLW